MSKNTRIKIYEQDQRITLEDSKLKKSPEYLKVLQNANNPIQHFHKKNIADMDDGLLCCVGSFSPTAD